MTADKIRCLRCDKVVTDPDAAMVNLRTDGTMFADGQQPDDMVADTSGRLDQGWFEVGADCYRKVLAAGAAGLAIAR